MSEADENTSAAIAACISVFQPRENLLDQRVREYVAQHGRKPSLKDLMDDIERRRACAQKRGADGASAESTDGTC
jgi:hypothetical protein